MPIKKPGEKFRYSPILRKRKAARNVMVALSLTAMVDMFTVLVVFLLQNFNTENIDESLLYIPENVVLPQAERTKELTPAVVVTISDREIMLNKEAVESFEQVQRQEDWMIEPLFHSVRELLEETRRIQEESLQRRIRQALQAGRSGVVDEEPNAWRKVTIQADKGIDFLTMKKVMYTVTEAGAGEINFAVTKRAEN